MNYQRQMMRSRTAKMFARVPGEHGDMAIPLYYPIAISSGAFGGPNAKVKEGLAPMSITVFCVFLPGLWYFHYKERGQFTIRCYGPGRVANRLPRYSAHYDIDDPDHWIKWDKLCEEDRLGTNYTGYQGANYLASYLWQPGDPEPDLRRRTPPEGAH